MGAGDMDINKYRVRKDRRRATRQWAVFAPGHTLRTVFVSDDHGQAMRAAYRLAGRQGLRHE